MEKFDNFRILTGTFFVCFGILAYEIFCSRLLAVVVGPHLVIFVIALAMMGISTATSFMSLSSTTQKTAINLKLLSWICISLGISYLISLYFISTFNNNANMEIDNLISNGGLSSLISSFHNDLFKRMLICGFVLFLPYFLFGILIGNLFRSAPANIYHKIYFSDLLGAAVGCFCCIYAFDIGGYPLALAIVLMSTFLSATSFAISQSNKTTILGLFLFSISLTIFFVPSLIKPFEPYPELSVLSRNWNKSRKVKELWHTWNSYSRVAFL